MLETTDFFEAQIKQRADLAARSTNKSDREFWLKMALRWGALLKNRQLDALPPKLGAASALSLTPISPTDQGGGKRRPRGRLGQRHHVP
jgi:hypothetical protein